MQITELEIINGGVTRLVRHIDGSEEPVLIRQLPLRLLPAFGQVQGDEAKLIELFTGHDAAWVDSLRLESAEEIITLGEELNRDPFVRWSERRLRASQRVQEVLGPLLQPASGSGKSAPPSAPVAGTPSNNSAN